MTIIAWIVLGAIAGYLAGFLVKGDEGLGVIGHPRRRVPRQRTVQRQARWAPRHHHDRRGGDRRGHRRRARQPHHDAVAQHRLTLSSLDRSPHPDRDEGSFHVAGRHATATPATMTPVCPRQAPRQAGSSRSPCHWGSGDRRSTTVERRRGPMRWNCNVLANHRFVVAPDAHLRCRSTSHALVPLERQ
jgi:hypothetical protein